MTEPLYILTRTSGRPKFFERCRASVKALSWPGKVIHIVHTDDPRDTYVEGEIIVKGETFGPSFGNGFYNLYQNRLLKAIPKGDTNAGWVHFLDDDDCYTSPDALNWLHGENRDAVHACKTRRIGVSKNAEIFPARWKKQHSFQTECFAAWSSIARKYEWWGQKGGDHHYTKKMVRKHPVIWHDVIATEAQEGKGCGDKLDAGQSTPDRSGAFPSDYYVYFKMFASLKGRKQTQLIDVPYFEALTLEKHGVGRVTFKGVETWPSGT